jgi:hypothetical protein
MLISEFSAPKWQRDTWTMDCWYSLQGNDLRHVFPSMHVRMKIGYSSNESTCPMLCLSCKVRISKMIHTQDREDVVYVQWRRISFASELERYYFKEVFEVKSIYQNQGVREAEKLFVQVGPESLTSNICIIIKGQTPWLVWPTRRPRFQLSFLFLVGSMPLHVQSRIIYSINTLNRALLRAKSAFSFPPRKRVTMSGPPPTLFWMWSGGKRTSRTSS